MKIRRTIPPTAAQLTLKNLMYGFAGIFAGKKYLIRLEEEVKEYFGVKHVFFTSSGKASLFLILRALKSLSVKKNKVIIPAYTCFSVPSAIVKAGLEVVPCDVDTDTLDFDSELLRESVKEDCLCVIPDHLFGIPSDMESINSLCKNRGVFVVEDAAQAMGGTDKNRKLGAIGDVGFFSLGRGKQITCGSGGIILTDSDSIASAIRKEYASIPAPNIVEDIIEFFKAVILSIFLRPPLYWFPAGLKFLKLGETFFYTNFPVKRLSGLQAGFLLDWRKRLEVSNEARSKNAAYFKSELKLGKGPASIDGVSFLRLPVLTGGEGERDRLYALSQKRGLGLSKMYPTPVSEIKEISELFSGKSYPAAKIVSERLITLPTHSLLAGRDKESICSLFKGTIPERAGIDRAMTGTGV